MPYCRVETVAGLVAETATARREAYYNALSVAKDVKATAGALRSLHTIVIGRTDRVRLVWSIASLPTALLTASSPPALLLKVASTLYTLSRAGTTVSALRDAAAALSLLLRQLEEV